MTPRDRGHRLIPFAFALTASGLAYLGLSTPGQRTGLAAPPPVPPRLLTAISGASLPSSGRAADRSRQSISRDDAGLPPPALHQLPWRTRYKVEKASGLGVRGIIPEEPAKRNSDHY